MKKLSRRVTAQGEFLQDYALLILFSFRIGIWLTAGHLWRDPEVQKIYVKEGKSQTKNSDHIDRRAGDLNFFIEGELIHDKEQVRVLGEFWKSLNPKNYWGGDFKTLDDPYHFGRKI